MRVLLGGQKHLHSYMTYSQGQPVKKRLDQQTYLAPNYLSRRGTTFKLLHTYILSLSHTDHFEDRWANAHCRIGISSLEVVK